jgi:diadenylate cyclase
MVKEIKDKLTKALKMVAPGTQLREGLENILRARTGALVVLANTPELMELVEGGFALNSDYSPSPLYELAKMDGAIVLSPDAKKIICANAQLIPSPGIPSVETGIRHRTAERVAKQTGEMVICISQRRNVITLYLANYKYVLRDLGVILNKANQALQTLEKYKVVLDKGISDLNTLEFEDLVTVVDVAKVIQRTEMVMHIVSEIEEYIIELGSEGRLVSMQLEELVANVIEEGLLIIQDYHVLGSDKSPRDIMASIKAGPGEEFLDLVNISKVIGYGTTLSVLDLLISPRGYRILRKIPRLPTSVIDNLVNTFGGLQNVLKASIEELDEVEGIGEVRARTIKEGLRRLREQVLLDRHV